MPTEVTQILSLVAHGNAFLEGDESVLENFYPTNQNFTFCKEVIFNLVDEETGDTIQTIFSPEEWFRFLKSSGAEHLSFFHTQPSATNWAGKDQQSFVMPARMSAGMIGGAGDNGIHITYGSEQTAWFVNWSLGDKTDPEEKIWNVTYISNNTKTLLIEESYSVSESRQALEQALERLIRFCGTDTQTLSSWQDVFTRAKDSLYAENPTSDQMLRSIFSEGHEPALEIQQLILAACRSFVFGGMGSWNDTRTPDQKEYEEASDELYTAIWKSLKVAAHHF